jgi:hypothetical protein
MHKKLMAACMAITASVAFVLASAASATTLTESGSALAVGSSFTAKNTSSVKFTGGYSLICEEAHLQGSLTQNNGAVVKGEIPVGGVTFTNAGGAACSSALGATTYTFTSKLCLETVKGTDNLSITGCGGSIVYDMTSAGVACKYEAASWSGTVKTNVTPAPLTISEQPAKEVGGLFFCPDEGRWDMAFDFYTTGAITGLTFS